MYFINASIKLYLFFNCSFLFHKLKHYYYTSIFTFAFPLQIKMIMLCIEQCLTFFMFSRAWKWNVYVFILTADPFEWRSHFKIFPVIFICTWVYFDFSLQWFLSADFLNFMVGCFFTSRRDNWLCSTDRDLQTSVLTSYLWHWRLPRVY